MYFRRRVAFAFDKSIAISLVQSFFRCPREKQRKQAPARRTREKSSSFRRRRCWWTPILLSTVLRAEAEAERDEAERTDLVIATSEAESGSGSGNDEVPRRQSQKMWRRQWCRRRRQDGGRLTVADQVFRTGIQRPDED